MKITLTYHDYPEAKSEKIPWERVDLCETADEIAALLASVEIRGRASALACPLAKATGWAICGGQRRRFHGGTGQLECRDLTRPEAQFVLRFDCGEFPFLLDVNEDDGEPSS